MKLAKLSVLCLVLFSLPSLAQTQDPARKANKNKPVSEKNKTPELGVSDRNSEPILKLFRKPMARNRIYLPYHVVGSSGVDSNRVYSKGLGLGYVRHFGSEHAVDFLFNHREFQENAGALRSIVESKDIAAHWQYSLMGSHDLNLKLGLGLTNELTINVVNASQSRATQWLSFWSAGLHLQASYKDVFDFPGTWSNQFFLGIGLSYRLYTADSLQNVYDLQMNLLGYRF